MTQYSSREPYNDDPEPYQMWFRDGWSAARARRFSAREEAHDELDKYGGSPRGGEVQVDPRPEFDRPQANPTNPILSKLRSLKSPHRANWIQGFMEQSEHVRFPNWNDNEVDHARRVLTRLANLNRGRGAAE